MTDAVSVAEWAAYLILIDRERSEAAFNKAVADCRRLLSEHRGDDIYVERDIAGAVEDLIFPDSLATRPDQCVLAGRTAGTSAGSARRTSQV